ncbi:hypothetical protein QYF61_024671, partial [Mycteria americana]
MFKGRVPPTHHATDATWSKWVALITQWAWIGNSSHPGILKVIMDWPEGKDFRISPEEEVMRAEEAPLYNKLSEDEKQYALFTDGSCHLVGKHQRWKAARPVLYLYTDSWTVANALWEWLQQRKQSNWQCRGKPIWAAALWQDIAAQVENLFVKVRHVDAHVPKSPATEEHQNNQQVDQAAKIEVAQVDLDWQHKGELFIAWWAHDTSGRQRRDATLSWFSPSRELSTMQPLTHSPPVGWGRELEEQKLLMNVKHALQSNKAKQLKPLCYGGRWLKYNEGEAWQIDYITLPQTCQGKHHVLIMVEATTRWLETYPVPHATTWNTILGLGKQVLWSKYTICSSHRSSSRTQPAAAACPAKGRFDKGYAYSIRHNYGKEGKRTDYTPYSCMKIIMSNPPSQGDYHGCPFRHSDPELLKQKLQSYKIPPSGITQ